MVSRLDVAGLRKWEVCGVTPMVLSRWERGGVIHPGKGKLGRRMAVNSVSGGKKGEKEAMGL